MAIFNFFGDFKVNAPEGLSCSNDLKELMGKAEYNILNFEAPVHVVDCAQIPKSGPSISQSIDSPKWVEDNGFNVVSLANNHICDMGIENAFSTKKLFQKTDCVGFGTWEEAYSIRDFSTIDGLKVGILACTHCEFGTLYDKLKDTVGAAWILHPDFRRLIVENRDKYDFLIVYAHGGIEYMNHPLPEWRETYKELIDLGADAVIASHPHVPQGWEIYKGKPICYSLGNFCFQKEGKVRDFWYNSICCSLSLQKDHELSMSISPIIYDPTSKIIALSSNDLFSLHLEKLNQTLRNDKLYIQYVNQFLINLFPQYEGHLARSGYVHYRGLSSFLKGFLDVLKGRPMYNKTHALNCIRCETHRWAMSRVFNLLFNV